MTITKKIATVVAVILITALVCQMAMFMTYQIHRDAVYGAVTGCVQALNEAGMPKQSAAIVCGGTAITYRGKPAADGPRYKALGNSMAVPVIRWIGERILLKATSHGGSHEL